jgi:hypothetical protein
MSEEPVVRAQESISSNGNYRSAEAGLDPTRRSITAAQKKYIERLIMQFEKAREVLATTQNNANDFIVYCADEQGIKLGEGSWQFDQETMEFIKPPPEKVNG